MTELLEKAFKEAGKLSENDQDTVAKWLLEELESERAWDEKFSRSKDLLKRLAEDARAEHEQGATEVLEPEKL